MASSNDDRVLQLRSHVSSHPEDARSKATLANYLLVGESAKSPEHGNDEPSIIVQEEAIRLAKSSINLAPDDAIGYGVLSTIPSIQFCDRIAYLRKAIDLEERSLERCGRNNASSRVAIATSLVRLLVEPREEEARDKERLKGKSIMRRDLGVNSISGLDERNIYEKAKVALETAKCIIWTRREERWKKKQNQQKSNHDCNNYISSSIPPNIQSLAKAHYRLGSLFRTMKPPTLHHAKAEHHFRSVIELLDPPHMNAQLQNMLHDMKVKSEFWLGTLDGIEHKVDRCPSEYVTSLYSSFAATFDEQLVDKLKYQTPIKLRDAVMDCIPKSLGTDLLSHGVDLGCGTGLSGDAFRDLVKHLSGVDLSAAMIEKAEGRGCYDFLRVGDVESIFQELGCNNIDLVVACDVFVYIGNLQSVFQTVSNYLTPSQGIFAFSTELLDEERTTVDNCGYLLQPCARFAHKKSYVCNLATECGFVVKTVKTDVIRQNGGRDVHGILAVLSLE